MACVGTQESKAALVFFDNVTIGGTSWNNTGMGQPGVSPSAAQAFKTGSDGGYAITKVTMMLAPFVTAAGNLTVRLEADNAGLPGSVLSTIFSGPGPTLSGLTAFSWSALNIPLSPNTQYWIAADLPNYPDGVLWAWDQNNVQPAVQVLQPLSNAYANDGVSHDPNWKQVFQDGPLGLEVEGVPEPQVWATSLLVLGGVAGHVIRRRRAAAV